jgi:hypothetical protein
MCYRRIQRNNRTHRPPFLQGQATRANTGSSHRTTTLLLSLTQPQPEHQKHQTQRTLLHNTAAQNHSIATGAPEAPNTARPRYSTQHNTTPTTTTLTLPPRGPHSGYPVRGIDLACNPAATPKVPVSRIPHTGTSQIYAHGVQAAHCAWAYLQGYVALLHHHFEVGVSCHLVNAATKGLWCMQV